MREIKEKRFRMFPEKILFIIVEKIFLSVRFSIIKLCYQVKKKQNLLKNIYCKTKKASYLLLVVSQKSG